MPDFPYDQRDDVRYKPRLSPAPLRQHASPGIVPMPGATLRAMELRHLRYFVAAAEEEHFARAADRLCITRPAVSQIISDLEDELGTQLFERKAHRVKLTAAGSTLLVRLQRLLADLNQTVEITRRVGSGKSGVLNIGYGSLTLLHPLFQDAIKQIHKEYPDVSLSLFELPSNQQISALRAGTLHAGFTYSAVTEGGSSARRIRHAGSPFDDNTEFGRLLIQKGRIAVALPMEHPLASRPFLRLADLVDENFIVVPVSSVSPSYGRLASLCMEAGFEARIVQEVTNIATQINLISVGMGIGLVVTMPGLRYPANIKVVPLRNVNYATKFQLMWMKKRRVEPVLEQFIGAVEQLAARTT